MVPGSQRVRGRKDGRRNFGRRSINSQIGTTRLVGQALRDKPADSITISAALGSTARRRNVEERVSPKIWRIAQSADSVAVSSKSQGMAELLKGVGGKHEICLFLS
jgi:hypothetical protein